MDINGNQVIAVDFDGTLCKQAWPEIGEENEILIEHLKEQQAAGARLILWTNREGDLLEEAVEWCKDGLQNSYVHRYEAIFQPASAGNPNRHLRTPSLPELYSPCCVQSAMLPEFYRHPCIH